MGTTTTQTSTGSSSSEPWKPMQPFLKNSATEADSLFNAGVGSQVYTGSLATPFANQTTQGMGLIEDFIKGPGGTWMQKPIQESAGMMDILSPIARGDFSNDTTFKNTLGAAQDDAATQVNLAMSDMGRYGSGVHQGTMARTIGDVTNDAMLKRQAWASDQLRGYGNDMAGNFASAMAPGGALMQIGGNYEQLMANQIADQLRIFNEQQNKPWEALARYNAIVSGAGQLGSSSTSKATTPSSQPSIGQQLLGFGLSALGG
jgi:hypothetical protein